MNEIIVLTREQLRDIIREAVMMASEDLTKQINNQKPEVMTIKQTAELLLVTQKSIINRTQRTEAKTHCLFAMPATDQVFGGLR